VSIIGEDPLKGRGLLEWVRKQADNSMVPAFSRRWWNGVTTLEWAKMAAAVVRHPFHGVLHVVPPYSLNKLTVLETIKQVYELKLDLEPTLEQHADDKTLQTEKGTVFVLPSLFDQLVTMRKFFATQSVPDADDNKQTK
jgi:hypothetical protein